MSITFVPLMDVFALFVGFDFSDWQDFLPLISFFLGVVGAIVFLFKSPFKHSPAIYILLTVLAFWPLMTQCTLYFLAHEVEHMTGSWPQVMADDPKNLMGLSPHYDALFHIVSYVQAFEGAWMLNFFLLLGVTWKRLNRKFLCGSLGLFYIVSAVSLLDFGSLWAWWMD